MAHSFRTSALILLAATFLILLCLLPAASAAEPTPGEVSPIPAPAVIGPTALPLAPSLDRTPDFPPPAAAPLAELNVTPLYPAGEPIASTEAEPTPGGALPSASPQAAVADASSPVSVVVPTILLTSDLPELPPAGAEPAGPSLDLSIESTPPTAVDSGNPESSPSAPPEALPPNAQASPTSASATPSQTASPSTPSTATTTLTGLVTPTPTETLTPTFSPTASLTPSPALHLMAMRGFSIGAVRINEIAWAGTLASSSDEWIELFNPGTEPVDLAGWRLTDGGDINRSLTGTLGPGEYYLLERTDNATVSDIPADLTYTGSLRNEGEALELLDPSGAWVDSANTAGGAWPAGDRATHASMQRLGPEDVWGTYPGCGGNGIDAGGAPIQGTPRQANALGCIPPTPTETATPTLAPLPTSVAEGAVRINEIAWSGTRASASDEWIESWNPGPEPIDLAGWRLSDGGDIEVALSGVLQPGELFLLERSDDQTVSDIRADHIYTGSLSNDGECLELLDPSGARVDVANRSGGAWPAGNDKAHASMERKESGGWGTFTGYFGNGRDADGNRIAGTPRQPNSLLFPTPMPTGIPGQIVINEVLIRPHYDWEGTGGIDYDDEFIELYNRGPRDVQLVGWILDDIAEGGSKPFVLPYRRIEADSYAVFFRSRTHLALNDTGDTVSLRAPNGHKFDTISYLRVRAYNLSYGRLPDGSDHCAYGLWPTPGRANRIHTPPSFPVGSVLISEVAWAGTRASANDEWIELMNPGEDPISLQGWALTDDNDIWVPLTGTLAPGGYFLLERSDDDTISDRRAEIIYRGALSDDGERLRLVDPSGREIDLINATGGAWPGGDKGSRASMERFAQGWVTFDGEFGRGLDADGWPILGTPGRANSRELETALSAVVDCAQGTAPAAGPCP